MFTYVELTNFKSFDKIRFDFRHSKNNCNDFIAIYGENGSGKSNFVSAFELLSKTLTSYASTRKIDEINAKISAAQKDDNFDFSELIEFSDLINVSRVLKKCRMIECEMDTKVEYGFIINGVEGRYSFSFNDSIKSEELYYLTNKQRGVLYSITQTDGKIACKLSKTLIRDKEYEKHLSKQITMFWGKHTFLSLLFNEFAEKNQKYMLETISDNLIAVIDTFLKVFVLCRSSIDESSGIATGTKFPMVDFSKIRMNKNDVERQRQANIIESIIRDFYTQAYSDIVDAFYVKNIVENHDNIIEYSLCVKKNIAGKIRTIPFEIESTGTQNVLRVLRAILEALNGQTVIYDEVDAGIHDLLISKMLLSVKDEITGQLIITTHNTLLLESLDPKSVYIIYADSDGNKEARCIDDYDIRIQASNNARKLYLNGVFGGIPYLSDIDYSNMHLKDVGAEE